MSVGVATEIKIDPEFRVCIPPLRPEELETLKQSILRDGCRDALVVARLVSMLNI